MERTVKEKWLRIADLLQQQLIAVFFLLVLWEVFKNLPLGNLGTWHIVLCVFGFAVCFVEALLVFNKDGIVKGVDRITRGKYHAGIMFLGFVSITIGVILKIYQKSDDGRDHFTTTHGRLGLSAWILTIIAIVSGPLSSNAKNLMKIGRPVWFKGIHLLLGIVAYIIGIVTLGFGLEYLSAYTGEHGRIALLVFLTINVLYSLVGSALTCFNFFTG